jgi:uncharacterized spore protein YtfJ
MSLNRLFDTVEKARETAQWRAAFGEAQTVEGQTLIPVAQVGYGFGLGFGEGPGKEGEAASGGEGGGAGGGASAKPLGVIVVTPEAVYFEETEDANRIAMAGIVLAGLLGLQFLKTVRAILARE